MRWVYFVGVAAIVGTFLADAWFWIDYRIGANVSLIYMAVLVTAFTVLYGVRSRWRGNRIGKVFFTKSVVLAFVLWQIVLATWDTEFPWRQQLRFVIYTLGAIGYIPMLVTLWREQQRDRERRQQERDQDVS